MDIRTDTSAAAILVPSAREAGTVRRFASLVLPSALVVAVLDGTFAVIAYVLVLHRYSVVGALQYIASGLLGQAAFHGGLAAAAFGAGMHLSLSFGVAALYAVVASALPSVRRGSGALVGLAYGASIWIVMSTLVLPLTGVPKSDDGTLFFLAFLADHMLLVGLPVAVMINARLRRSERSADAEG